MANTKPPSLDNILENAIKILEKEGYKDVAENSREFLKKSERTLGGYYGYGLPVREIADVYVDIWREEKMDYYFLDIRLQRSSVISKIISKILRRTLEKRKRTELKPGYVGIIATNATMVINTENNEIKVIPYVGKGKKKIGEIEAIVVPYKDEKGEAITYVYRTDISRMYLNYLGLWITPQFFQRRVKNKNS